MNHHLSPSYAYERDIQHKAAFDLFGENGKEILEILIDKYNAGERTQYDLLTMYTHDLKRLPFGTWVVNRSDVVPILKAICRRLSGEVRKENERIEQSKEIIRQEIRERKHNEFSKNSLEYKLSFDYLLPELHTLLKRYQWLLRLAKGTHQPESLKLEEVKSIPIATVLGERGSSYTKHTRQFYKCPLHSENTPSFCWYVQNNSWYCFGGCGVGGDVIDLYMKMNKCDFMTAVKALQKLI
jgi:hypothetical protein